jgi:hypothetical protein
LRDRHQQNARHSEVFGGLDVGTKIVDDDARCGRDSGKSRKVCSSNPVSGLRAVHPFLSYGEVEALMWASLSEMPSQRRAARLDIGGGGVSDCGAAPVGNYENEIPGVATRGGGTF